MLTDAKIKAHKVDPTKITRLWDSPGSGLHVECRPNGSRLFIFRYWYGGRARRASCGAYPTVSLKEARQRRDDMRRQLRDGVNPVEARRQARRLQTLAAGHTVRVVVEEWLRDRRAGWTDAYAEDVARAFTLHIFPKLGARPIASVQPLDLLDALRALGPRRELARRLRQKLEQIWNFAIITGRADTNVAAPLKGQLNAPVVAGFKAIPETQIAALLDAVRGAGNQLVTYAVWLQVLTATRPGETRGARWDEFDMQHNVWTIPAGRMKKRRPHVVPLSRQARAVLDALRPLTGDHALLFPSRGERGKPMSEATVSGVWRRVGFGQYHPHGLRKLFSTVANEAGQRHDVIEACLAHVDSSVRGTYNLAEHLQARLTLLEWWGDRLDALCAAESAKPRRIVPWAASPTGDDEPPAILSE